MNFKLLLFFVSSLLLTGCATQYRAPNDKAKAKLIVDMESDSTNTTLISIYVRAHDMPDCNPSPHGETLTSERFANKKTTLAPEDIIAGEQFTFTVSYIEARFAQNRSCSFTASFVPEVDMTYFAHFRSLNNGMTCDLKMDDHQKKPVAFTEPEFSCVKSLAGQSIQNRKASILNWRVTATTVPAKEK